MDNSLLAVRGINHKYIVVGRYWPNGFSYHAEAPAYRYRYPVSVQSLSASAAPDFPAEYVSRSLHGTVPFSGTI